MFTVKGEIGNKNSRVEVTAAKGSMYVQLTYNAFAFFLMGWGKLPMVSILPIGPLISNGGDNYKAPGPETTHPTPTPGLGSFTPRELSREVMTPESTKDLRDVNQEESAKSFTTSTGPKDGDRFDVEQTLGHIAKNEGAM